MPPSSTVTTPSLASAIRPLLHEKLAPLFDQANPCLPALEQTCQKILSLSGTVAGADQLAAVISRDPGLTCKVLQVANSIAYSPQHMITSVPHAVTWLGLDTVRSMVAIAKLVEQLRDWPDRQQTVSGVIGRALMAAVHANELGIAVEHASLSQLFSSALLYSIGDLAIAYQAPELYQALRALSCSPRTRAERTAEEIKIIGVPKLRLAKALAEMWALPDHVTELFSLELDEVEYRWHSGRQTFGGLIVGSTTLVEALTGPTSRSAVEQAKRPLLKGTGLPPQIFGDILSRAFDRGRQLVRSSGLSLDQHPDAPQPAPVETIPDGLTRTGSKPAAVSLTPRGASALETHPLETLQALQQALAGAKDLNSLLSTLVHALHRDGGFSRVALALLNPNDSDQLIGRLVLGVDPPTPYLASLSGSLTQDHPGFLSLLKRTDPSFLERAGQTSPPLNPAFLQLWKPAAAIIAPLRIGNRPIGMVYGDGGPAPCSIQSKDYQGFQLFLVQTTLGINRLAGLL